MYRLLGILGVCFLIRPLLALDLQGQSVQVFGSRDGITVTLVRLEPADEGKAIVIVNGSGSLWDDRPLLHHFNDPGNHAEWKTKNGKEDFITLFGTRGGGETSWDLRLPDHKGNVSLHYDKKLSGKASMQKIVQRYERSKDPQTKPDRDTENKALERYVELANRSCKTKLTAKIEWSSVGDTLLKEKQIAAFCEPVLFALRDLCQEEFARKVVQQKIQSINCQFGDKLEAKGPTSGVLHWTTGLTAEEDSAYAKAYLLKNL